MNKRKSYEGLEKSTAEYFTSCDERNSGQKSIIKPYTLSGLLCHLGITRREFERLMKTKKYSPVLIKAKAKIEAFIEENSLTGGLTANASSNSLKYNFGWGEKESDTAENESKKLIVVLDGDAEKLAK